MSVREHLPRRSRGLGAATALTFVALLLPTTLVAPPAAAAGLDLHRGSHGQKVRVLEVRLNRLGYLLASAVDGRYRAATVNAVRRYQRDHRVKVNGKVNRRIWRMIARDVVRQQQALPPAPDIIGHRGTVRPWIAENTVKSLQFAHGYADVLEFDLRVTADHEIVLMHDATLARTTNCTGQVSTWTLADLRAQCRAGQQPIPTLSEVAAYAASVPEAIAPEIKDATISDEDLATVLDLLDEHGLAGRTFLQSFSPDVLKRVRAQRPALLTVLDSTQPPTVGAVQEAGASRVAVRLSNLTAAQVKLYQRSGLEVWAYTAVDRAGLLAARTRGVDAVVTDIPRTAVTYYRG